MVKAVKHLRNGEKVERDLTAEEIQERSEHTQLAATRRSELKKAQRATNRLNALNITRDELLDVILSAMNTAQLSGQVNWSQPLDGILSAWARERDKDIG